MGKNHKDICEEESEVSEEIYEEDSISDDEFGEE